MTAPAEVHKLVERFDYNLADYKKGRYNETQVRREFIDPFFKILGWDIDNEKGYAEAYKEVVHEDAIKVGRATKAPDYSFRIGGVRKFFLEAKKPSIDIKHDTHPAYQLRRYAWSAKLPLSILTDFEEFAVYDGRIKPVKTDKASNARVMYITYKDYIDRWQELTEIFAPESIRMGVFDKFVETTKVKKGTAEVDNAFLQEIERWRDMLARNIALRNTISQRELNFAVQLTIDRLIFLRIAEDRGIEPYGQLRDLSKQANLYNQLLTLFHRADDRYNSGLFHFRTEKGRDDPDNLTPNLSIDDKVFQDIFKNLYYPDSPYEFSVLPADILGQVYEQFLGKVILLTSGGRAKIEDKPEVKKAGGVYYTPTYIVDYIVNQTVGQLVEGKTPNKLGGRNPLRILDPACGSGSFLLGAYQFLLDWYRDQYVADEKGPERWLNSRPPRLYQTGKGEWKLTTDERKRILVAHIFGVDIDPQAVEVTKLSLLLKVLEGEDEQSLARQLAFAGFGERVLPDLVDNIKCGNSLIGSDFYVNQPAQLSMFDDEDEFYRINAFDWDSEFAEIMKDGAFNVVIGNPPYVDIKALPKTDVEYIFNTYSSANNRINLFATFFEKSLFILRSSQFRFSMIIPTALLTQDSYKTLRRMIIDNYHLSNVVRLPNESFGSSAGDVKVDTAIVVIEQKQSIESLVEMIGYSGYDRISQIDPNDAQVHGYVKQSTWAEAKDSVWSINTTEIDLSILHKCEKNSLPLVECAEFCLGLTPYDKYKGHTPEQIKGKVFHASYQKDETFKKLLAGNDVMRYFVLWNGNNWISYGTWLGAPREQRFFTEKRILVKQIIDWTSKRLWASITDEELYNTQNAFNLLPKLGWVHEYLLGILNSRLMTFYHRKKYLDEFKMRFQKVLIKDCKQFPIHIINIENSPEKAQHDKMVNLVERILSLHKQLNDAKIPQAKKMLKRQIETTDRQIDKLVYELYGLTDEEIRIIEGAV